MPDRFHVSLNRTAWAANRLASNSPPSSQPPGNGNLPGRFAVGETLKKTCPKRTKICSGIQASPVRKYLLSTVQIPSSLWASVPKNTSTMERAMSTTVIRRAANSVRARLTRERMPARGAVADLTRSETRASGVWIAVLFIFASSIPRKLNGAQEGLKSSFLLCHETSRTFHLNDQRRLAAKEAAAENPRPRPAGRCRTAQLDKTPR